MTISPRPANAPAARLIDLPAISDARGHLGVISAAHDLGFSIARVFYIYHAPETAKRGGHAHKTLHQFLFVIGTAPIVLGIDDGQHKTPFTIAPHRQGLHIPPLHWVDIKHIPAGSSIVVLCSHEYDEADYLRHYPDFLQHCRVAQGAG